MKYNDSLSDKDRYLDHMMGEVLDEDLSFELPGLFAEKVVALAIKKQQQKRKVRNLLVYFSVLFASFVVPVALTLIFKADIFSVYMGYLWEYKWIIVFTIILFAGIQTADYLWVKKDRELMYD